MTDEEISKLTIGDIELIASRLRVAVQTLQEARGLLGGPPAVTVSQPAAQGASPAVLTAHEQARKEMLMEQNKSLPPEILAAMENGGKSIRGG